MDDRLITRPDFREKPGRRVDTNKIASALIENRGEKPIRSFHVYGGNLATLVCCQKGILEGLLHPDLFAVVHERFMTDTIIYADILLPATFSVEQTDVYATYGYCAFGTVRKIVEPTGRSKNNWNTFHPLARTVGHGEKYFRRTEEKTVRELPACPMEGLTRTLEKGWRILGKGGVVSTTFADHRSFRMPSGRMIIYNENLEETMSRYVKSHGEVHPLWLVTIPDAYTPNPVFMDREDLSSSGGPMTLMLHPRDAAARKIADGSHVAVFNESAKVEFTAKIMPVVAEGTVAVRGVYNRTFTRDGLLVNTLHYERLSDIEAAITLDDSAVDVRPC